MKLWVFHIGGDWHDQEELVVVAQTPRVAKKLAKAWAAGYGNSRVVTAVENAGDPELASGRVYYNSGCDD